MSSLEGLVKGMVNDFSAGHRQDYFKRVTRIIKGVGLYPDINVITGPSSLPRITINGKEYLTFSSNNYLGLAMKEDLVKATIYHLKKYGIGSGSTRILSGTLDVQIELERKLANFLDFESAITFSSGFLANIGVIRMLVDPFPYTRLLSHRQEGVILFDELNHASVFDGIRLSRARRIVYKHNNMDELSYLLEKNKEKRKLIISDTVFSMDGDIADLKSLTRLAKENDALIFLDDSHGVGILGPNGEGAAHHFGVQGDVDVLMGSFTKSFGSIGGYVACSGTIEEYLRMTARSFIFSDPIIPSVVAGLIESILQIKQGHTLREKVIFNASYLRDELTGLGFQVLGSLVPIVPIIIGDEKKVIQFSDQLKENGILAPAIRRPAVLEGKERLRLSLMATHTREDIDNLLCNCRKIGRNLGII